MPPGIIFLSAMGSSIATLCLDAGKDAEVALGTALLTMTVSTFLVGLGTLLVGEDAPGSASLGKRLLWQTPTNRAPSSCRQIGRVGIIRFASTPDFDLAPPLAAQPAATGPPLYSTSRCP